MAIDWTKLSNRIGKGVYLVNLCNEFRGAVGSGAIATDLPTEWEDFVEQYDAETDPLRATLGDPTSELYSAQDGLNGIAQWVSSALGQTIIVTTNANNPLSSHELSVGMAELIAQMTAGSKTVNANAVVPAATAGGSNVGTGKCVLSAKDGHGRTLEYSYAETLVATFTSTTSAQIIGTERADSLLAYNWPKGSGASSQVSTVTADGSDNLVSNGTFETFTVANTPDDWAIITGSAGTQVLSEASIIYTGSKAVAIVGDGSTLTQIRQLLDNDTLEPKTPYAVNFFARVSASPGAGVLTVDLYDGTSVINDETGTANSFTVALTSLLTTYAPRNGVFRLPEPLPAAVYLRLRLSTALSASRTAYFDELAMVPMTQLYTGGPYCAIFDGAVAWSLDDTISINVVNDYGGLLQMAFWRLFDMPELDLVLPSNASGSENILDSVIS